MSIEPDELFDLGYETRAEIERMIERAIKAHDAERQSAELPDCEGLEVYDDVGERWYSAAGVSGMTDEEAIDQTPDYFRRCIGEAYRPEIDPRFGKPLCRHCFYERAKAWRTQNRHAGLCACGMDTMPGIKECRDCNARSRRRATAAVNRAKAAAKEAAKEKERQQLLAAQERAVKAAVDALTVETVLAGVEAHQGDVPAWSHSLVEGIPDATYIEHNGYRRLDRVRKATDGLVMRVAGRIRKLGCRPEIEAIRIRHGWTFKVKNDGGKVWKRPAA